MASPKGISTIGVTLKWGASASALDKFVEIKDYPDLGGAPEMIEITTLSDDTQAFALGVQALEALEFTYNQTLDNYKTVNGDARKDLYYELSFGKDGSEGVFAWQGQHTTYVSGKGVNEGAEAKMVIAATTKPELKEAVGG